MGILDSLRLGTRHYTLDVLVSRISESVKQSKPVLLLHWPELCTTGPDCSQIRHTVLTVIRCHRYFPTFGKRKAL